MKHFLSDEFFKEIDKKIKSAEEIIEKRIQTYNGEQILVVKNIFENRLTESGFPHCKTEDFMTQTLNLGILDHNIHENGFLPVAGYVKHKDDYYKERSRSHIRKENGSYWGSVFPKINWKLSDEKLRFPSCYSSFKLDFLLDEKPSRKEHVQWKEKYRDKQNIFFFIGNNDVASYFANAEYETKWKSDETFLNPDKVDPISIVDLSYLDALSLLKFDLNKIPSPHKKMYKEKLRRKLIVLYETLGHKVGEGVSFCTSNLESIALLNKDLTELLKAGQDAGIIPYVTENDIKPQLEKELNSKYKDISSQIRTYLDYLKKISKQ